MTAATLLVLLIIVVELYRPIIIGDAIDDYINGYYRPYYVADESTPETVSYGELYLARVPLDNENPKDEETKDKNSEDENSEDASAENLSTDNTYYQILL